jgi:hypothetical protein
LAKFTYARGRKSKGLGDLSQFVYLVEPLWFSPSGIGVFTQFVSC